MLGSHTLKAHTHKQDIIALTLGSLLFCIEPMSKKHGHVLQFTLSTFFCRAVFRNYYYAERCGAEICNVFSTF